MHVVIIFVTRILYWRGAQTANHMQCRHQKFSKEELFVGQRYRRMEDQKPWLVLALNQDFAKRRVLKPSQKSENVQIGRRVKFLS